MDDNYDDMNNYSDNRQPQFFFGLQPGMGGFFGSPYFQQGMLPGFGPGRPPFGQPGGGPPFGQPGGGPPFGQPGGGPPFGQPGGGPPFGQPGGGPPFGQPGGGPPFGQPGGGPPFGQPGGGPPFGQPGGGPPFGQPGGGSPLGPGGGPGGGLESGPPSGPPPSFTPSQAAAQQSVGVFAVNPGAIRPCRYRYTYIWLTNGRQFWIWPVFIGRDSLAGWRWTGFNWVYFGIDLSQISSFVCY